MNIYTKNGDKGTTDLIRTKNVSKSDDRIQLVGAIDELTSHLGLVKTMVADVDTIRVIEKIQATLITVMAGVADPYNREYKINDDKTEILESEIDRMEALFDRPKQFILPGENPVSAQIDVTRTVARRAERCLSQVSIKFGSDTGAKRFMNRLADYLYVLARYYDAVYAKNADITNKDKNSVEGQENAGTGIVTAKENNVMNTNQTEETLIQQVLMRMGQGRMTLETSKKLIEKIEEEAKRRGKQAVIAVCTPDGNPVAVHVMDGAFLVSFDVAVRKAYTSVAVKMSTMELSKLAQPGQTFYGLDKLEGGKIVIFGGGVPLIHNGVIIGGLGISGGTGEEDHSLAEYGLSVLEDILKS